MVHLLLFAWTLEWNGILVVGDLAVGVTYSYVVAIYVTLVSHTCVSVRSFVDSAEGLGVWNCPICLVNGVAVALDIALLVYLDLELGNMLFHFRLR